jgi:hypothetical protein
MNSPKAWAAVILFFAVGVAIASVAAVGMLQRGRSQILAVLFASSIGGFGAWFIFFVAHKIIRWIRSAVRSISGRDPAD